MVDLKPVLYAHLLRAHLARIRIYTRQLLLASRHGTPGLFVYFVIVAGVAAFCPYMAVKRDVRVLPARHVYPFRADWAHDDF